MDRVSTVLPDPGRSWAASPRIARPKTGAREETKRPCGCTQLARRMRRALGVRRSSSGLHRSRSITSRYEGVSVHPPHEWTGKLSRCLHSAGPMVSGHGKAYHAPSPTMPSCWGWGETPVSRGTCPGLWGRMVKRLKQSFRRDSPWSKWSATRSSPVTGIPGMAPAPAWSR